MGVPTLEVVAHNAPPAHEHVVVCLNLKRGTVYCAVYRRSGETLVPTIEPALREMEALLREAPQPVALLGEMLPELPGEGMEGVTVLPAEMARPRAAVVWHLGRDRAVRGEYDDPLTLEPRYVRRPEAVELWERRGKAEAKTPTSQPSTK